MLATRVVIDWRRRRKFAPTQLAADNEPRDLTTPKTERSRRELGIAVERAAASLPNEQRDTFVLAEFHGLREVGRVLGVPEATAKTRSTP